MAALKVGPGQEEGVDVGPLIDADAVESVSGLVTDAVHDGATLVCGGSPVDGPGYFYPPTVLVGVPADARINGVEIFGPVAPITTFPDEADAVAQANGTEYGLVSYVYTRDLHRTIRLWSRSTSAWSASTPAGVEPRGAVRRGEGERLRARGRLRGD